MIKNNIEVGIAIENHSAIEFTNGHYKIHQSQPMAKAYKIINKREGTVAVELNNFNEYKAIHDLY